MRQADLDEEYPERVFWWPPAAFFRQWTNAPPEANAERILTKSGRVYWCTRAGEGDFAFLHLEYRQNRIGIMRLVNEPEKDRLHLLDVIISERHQKHGLGTWLLGQAESHARRRGLPVIAGEVVAKDVEAFPGLLSWYERNGFEVEPVQGTPPPGHEGEVAYIRKRIAPL